MRKIIEMIYMTLVSLFADNYKNNQPKRLNKQKEQKKIEWNVNYTQLLFIIAVITILLISAYIIYQTGSLESTRYYYRING